MPPTAQNQSAIEDDLRRVMAANLHLDDDALAALCERTIRTYDPCISCPRTSWSCGWNAGEDGRRRDRQPVPARRRGRTGRDRPAAEPGGTGGSLVVSDGEPTSRLDAWSDGGAVVVVDGIEVADTRWGPGLSPDVAAGAGAAAERILAEPGVRPRAER
jgi:hypothetical protein